MMRLYQVHRYKMRRLRPYLYTLRMVESLILVNPSAVDFVATGAGLCAGF